MALNPIAIRPADLARINNAVKKIERLPATQPRRPGAPERFVDSVPFYNNSGSTVPANAIIWLDDLHADGVSHIADKPPFSAIRKYAVATAATPPSDRGRAWIRGIRRVIVLLLDGQTLTEGDAVAPRRNAWTAQKFALGPMLVHRVISQDGLEVTADVLLGEWRGDEIYIRDNNDIVSGPFCARRWSPAFALSQPFPGKTLIEAAS